MSKLTEQEVEAIRKEAKYCYPRDNTICEVYLSKRDAHIFAVTVEREKIKENAVFILDLFKIFMPDEVDISDRKQMAMYEAYHRIRKIIEPEK